MPGTCGGAGRPLSSRRTQRPRCWPAAGLARRGSEGTLSPGPPPFSAGFESCDMIQAADPPIILATASSARRAVLAAVGIRFTAEASAVDEAAIKASAQAEAIPADDTALLLAD